MAVKYKNGQQKYVNHFGFRIFCQLTFVFLFALDQYLE